MTESMSTSGRSTSGSIGEDFVCADCGCEVMVKHWGEPRSHADSGAFTCHCGQRMEPEHPGEGGHMRQEAGHGDGFDQNDFLGQGGGAGETSSSPEGGR